MTTELGTGVRAERRYWGVAVVGALLAFSAVALERPVLVVGAAGVGAWLVSRQYAFVRAAAATRSALRVEQETERPAALVRRPIPVSFRVRLAWPSALALRVEQRPPVSMRRSGTGRSVAGHSDIGRSDAGKSASERPRVGGPAVTLPPGEIAAERTDTYEAQVAGDHAFDPPSVTVSDPSGLFSQRFTHGTGRTVAVEPRRPRDLHVGEGGEQVVAAYGGQSERRRGSGLEFAELRKYVTGDPASEIDWKTTARMGEPYVREYETETTNSTAIVFDHRASLGDGPEGATKLDYLRQVALAVARDAHDRDDPVGLYAVGDGGATELLRPGAKEDRYDEVRRAIREASPTGTDRGPERNQKQTVTPATARRMAEDLTGTDDFAATLRPYVESADDYASQLDDRPLVETVRVADSRFRNADSSVLLTDDADLAETLETVKLLHRGGGRVLVFLAPGVLFESGGLADFERAYARYVEFEEFRRRLERLDRVSALEVAPGNRVDAVLDERRRRPKT
ncbi:DUF58 domain-containing protein [Halorussus caseinilyticus]|uniref:DUF58 domain-containing protein n=1 Tax=Halorussus caseinilyticus TaxID=3034025 RepID=UPI0023E7D435|nr:DUF58 domain-containing protein [Halorussus sp. DT72]